MKIATLLAALGALSTYAHAGTIDFEADSWGAKPNGFVSASSADLSFSDSEGADLFVLPYIETNDTNGLATNFDGYTDIFFGDVPDSSFLVINSAVTLTSISLDFGNDDPDATTDGDYAQLRAFLGATQVGSADFVMNRDDLANQTASFSLGSGFDRVEFEYITSPTDSQIYPGTTWTSVAEVVDNISYEPVPEPASMAVLGLGLAAIARKRRNR
jgi:hypothetical protein